MHLKSRRAQFKQKSDIFDIESDLSKRNEESGNEDVVRLAACAFASFLAKVFIHGKKDFEK